MYVTKAFAHLHSNILIIKKSLAHQTLSTKHQTEFLRI